MSHNVIHNRIGARQTCKGMNSFSSLESLLLIASLCAAIPYQRNNDLEYDRWNMVLSWWYALCMQALLGWNYILMEGLKFGSWNHLFYRKVLFSNDPHFQICTSNVLMFCNSKVDVVPLLIATYWRKVHSLI